MCTNNTCVVVYSYYSSAVMPKIPTPSIYYSTIVPAWYCCQPAVCQQSINRQPPDRNIQSTFRHLFLPRRKKGSEMKIYIDHNIAASKFDASLSCLPDARHSTVSLRFGVPATFPGPLNSCEVTSAEISLNLLNPFTIQDWNISLASEQA